VRYRATHIYSMRREKIVIGEYYHIYNRGIHKKILFHDTSDHSRFLFLILYFQSLAQFPNIIRIISSYRKKNLFPVSFTDTKNIIKSRSVELVSFCIMPNHFHLLMKEVKENGVAQYMHRVLGGYSRYYNNKYGTSGHLFQGSYKFTHIHNNEQLLYNTAYIHRNPRTLKDWYKKEHVYPWSSYQDYVVKNRYEGLLLPDIVLAQFKELDEYEKFLKTSTAKLSLEELSEL